MLVHLIGAVGRLLLAAAALMPVCLRIWKVRNTLKLFYGETTNRLRTQVFHYSAGAEESNQ